MGRVRSPKRRVRDNDFIVGLCSDIVGYRRIVFLLAEALQGFCDYILSFKISWQVQYLVRLGVDFTGSTHWKWRFICDADYRWHSFCVAGAVFGEVGGCFYLLRALEMTFYMWRRSSMTFILRGRCSICWGWRLTLLALRIANNVSYLTQILLTPILRGRRSICWIWRVTLFAPRIVNDVSYVMRIIDDIGFVWQAQHLVRLEGDFACSAHWKWRFICDTDYWWFAFCVAGAVFGEVGGWL